MRVTARPLTALVASLALAAGALTVTAGAARAADPIDQIPVGVDAWGRNYRVFAQWSEPWNDDEVVGYRARVYAAADLDRVAPVSTRTLYSTAAYLSTDFSGLVAGQQYVVGVVSLFEDTTTSVETYSPTVTAYRPAPAVTGLNVKASRNSVAASWRAPATSALTGKLSSYYVEVSPYGGYPVILAPSQRTIRFTGLTNGRRYTVRVTAVAGDTGAAAAGSATPIGSPARPTKLKRAWKKNGKAKLTWKPARSTVAAPVTGYYVYVNGRRVATLTGRSKASYTFTKQKKGRKYSFAVRARNPVGYSSAATIATKKRPIR